MVFLGFYNVNRMHHSTVVFILIFFFFSDTIRVIKRRYEFDVVMEYLCIPKIDAIKLERCESGMLINQHGRVPIEIVCISKGMGDEEEDDNNNTNANGNDTTTDDSIDDKEQDDLTPLPLRIGKIARTF